MAYFGHRQCFISGFLLFSFSVFSLYKNHHLLFLAIFPDLEIIPFWFVNYLCRVSKSYFYFGHVRSFLVSTKSFLLLAFVNYTL